MHDSRDYRRFLAELKRRKVFRAMAVYGASAFAAMQAADLIFPRIPLPDWTVTLVEGWRRPEPPPHRNRFLNSNE